MFCHCTRAIKNNHRLKSIEDQKEQVNSLHDTLSPSQNRCIELAQENGSSSWLTALPLDIHGFALHKAAFRDALALRYNWPLQNVPTTCGCGHKFDIEHVLSCPSGGFPSVRHNEVRDLTAHLLTEVCHGVCTEPHLQPLDGEVLHHRSANSGDQARLDVDMFGFWGGRFEKAFLDIRVFNPSAKSNRSTTLKSTYCRHEQEKKRQYEERIREVEHASFAPLVMSCTGGMGTIATSFYKRLASLISEKRDVPYSQLLHLLRCKLEFALIRSSIMCIHGARSRTSHYSHEPFALQITEGHLTLITTKMLLM